MLLLTLASCAGGKERVFTGSTPAGYDVRVFLGMSTSDSIDFIRWSLTIGDKDYKLECNYGVGKPNTKGFWNGGKFIRLSGELKKEKNTYYLINGNNSLGLLELNENLLHLLNYNKHMLVGTGGWSYTLCKENAITSDKLNIPPPGFVFSDSMAYHGRTPCPGLDTRKECLKLKWSLVLFADPKTNRPMGYRMRGTVSTHANITGNWNIQHGKDGRIIYQLNNAVGNESLYLVSIDENLLAFSDAKGNLLIGDSDFSYTLNRKL